MPDAALYKACGNRRASQCPSCAWIYKGDAFQVVRFGLAGGKGVPATVTVHPTVFATFTAPSFGTVHHRNVVRHSCRHRRACRCESAPCNARRGGGVCPHGRPATCFVRHEEDDPRIGQPLCLDCYDHRGQVVWNHYSGELWRRTKQAVERQLAKVCRARGIPRVEVVSPSGAVRRVPPVRVSHGKVAEMQRRGAVHFHVVLRLDGVDPDEPTAVVPPPAGLDIADLEDAIRTAAKQVSHTTPGHSVHRPGGWVVAWGQQLDVRRIGDSAGQITHATVAAYVAKYATKAVEVTGHHSPPITRDTIAFYGRPDGTHVERLVFAC